MKRGFIKCDQCGKQFDSENALQCRLPGSDGEPEVIEMLCPDCNDGSSYCKGCGEFCAGMERFEFGQYAGYCDNCADEMESEMADEFDDSEYEEPDYDEESENNSPFDSRNL